MRHVYGLRFCGGDDVVCVLVSLVINCVGIDAFHFPLIPGRKIRATRRAGGGQSGEALFWCQAVPQRTWAPGAVGWGSVTLSSPLCFMDLQKTLQAAALLN